MTWICSDAHKWGGVRVRTMAQQARMHQLPYMSMMYTKHCHGINDNYFAFDS